MPSRRKRSKAVPFNAADITNIAKSNPYVQRLLGDPKLRKNLTTAVSSSKSAYARLSNGKLPSKALLEDRKLHADISRALGAARDATLTLSKTQRKRARRGTSAGRKLMIVTLGGGLALVGSQTLRSKVLDLLFGAEEEFEYTPPVSTPSQESSETVGAA